MKIKVISKETIKPSSPTPHQLRTFNLSFLDQLIPPFYVPFLLFYSATDELDHRLVQDNQVTSNNNNDARNVQSIGRSDLLKRSLSETLTRFYPVAGRVKANISIDCNDEGIDYFQVRINGKMSDFMSVDVLHQLHPSHIVSNKLVTGAQLVVQVNMFDCGGIAISMCFSHKIFDASTIITFINSWATTARGVPTEDISCPTFDSSSLFPTLPAGGDVSLLELEDDSGKVENVVTKTFVFQASQIRDLRARIAESSSTTVSSNKYPTRVEAVSAIIWQSIMKASRVKSSGNSLSLSLKPVRSIVNCPVNLRGRMDPPLSQVSFGNIIRPATVARTIMPLKDETLDGLVGQLRLAISKIDSEYIRKLQAGDEELQQTINEGDDVYDNENVVDVWIISFCRFPFYETDFGWGKPLWVACNANVEYKNSLHLMDTKCGEGIEAWVSLEEGDMAIFEKDQELLKYVN